MVREKDMQIDRDREKERVTRAMFLSSKHDFGVSWHPRSYLPRLGADDKNSHQQAILIVPM